jgi:uncharacterized ferritin-like protein (DUF455 family)
VPDSIRAFAEQVLFSADLELKLAAPPASLVDSGEPGSTPLPELPARPHDLRWKARGEPFRFPSRINSDRERGLLLHHMANHELLAVELMALALLKFPDAPPAFRRGLLGTLAEEQEHTRLYLERMRACGVALGELPVSGFFWRMIAPMATPMDYVTRLSLTFEQANLDYARAYAAQFEQLGDPDTAGLFHRIHADEIGHVGYGLHWFRKWKDPARSDWEAFRSQLPEHIPAARARGIGFDPDGRTRAGLDLEFIRRLRVEPLRPTRPVTVHWMNAGPDAGPAAPARVRDALTLLPVAWMREGDVLLTAAQPGADWLEFLAGNGLPVPRCAAPEHACVEGEVSHLEPWAWTPAARRVESGLGARAPHAPPDLARLEPLFLKTSAPPLLREVAAAMEISGAGSEPGKIASSNGDVGAHREAFAKLGFDGCVVKGLHSCAGRERVRIPRKHGDIGGREAAWIRSAITRDGAVVVEPWFERALDFSVHFTLGPEGAAFAGVTEMFNTPAGTWRSSLVQPVLASGTPFARFLHAGRTSLMERLVSSLAAALARAFEGTGYRGPAGVDAFLFRMPDKSLALRPVVELNPRRTMGRALLDAMRRTGSGRAGRLRFVTAPTAPSLGESTWPGPWSVLRDPSGAIASARIPLADPSGSRLIPVWEVASGPGALTSTDETAGAPRA